jgi:hypothetical protein
VGFLSGFGKVVIGLSVLGSVYGMYEGYALQDVYFFGLTFLGLIGGVYVGFLGIKIEEMEEMGSDGTSRLAYRELEIKVQNLEYKLNQTDTEPDENQSVLDSL